MSTKIAKAGRVFADEVLGVSFMEATSDVFAFGELVEGALDSLKRRLRLEVSEYEVALRARNSVRDLYG